MVFTAHADEFGLRLVVADSARYGRVFGSFEAEFEFVGAVAERYELSCAWRKSSLVACEVMVVELYKLIRVSRWFRRG